MRGSQLMVTPQKVIDPATGADFLSKPKKGQHYVAVVVTLELVPGT